MEDREIPELIKELRGHLGMTQEQFAQEVGVTFSTVNSWENGKRRPLPFLVRPLLQMEEELNSKRRNQKRGNRTRR